MKYIKTINELYDDEYLRDRDEIRYMSKNINKQELSKTATFYSNRINNLILSKLPFYKKGNPSVFVDYVKYTFGNKKEELVVIIEGQMLEGELNAFILHLYHRKNGICSNPQDAGDVYNITELIEVLDSFIPAIEKGFVITNNTLN